jgi:hypothetical protein
LAELCDRFLDGMRDFIHGVQSFKALRSWHIE